MTRRKLPNCRPSLTFQVQHGQNVYTVSVGGDGENAAVAEVFIGGPKAGTDLQAAVRDAAILTSLALQHDCPIETINHALTRDDGGRPASIVGSVVAAIVELGGTSHS